MTRILFVRAGKNNKLADDFVNLGIVAVGWSKLGDLSFLSADVINSLLREKHPDGIKVNGELKKHYAEIIDFAFLAKSGDLVATIDGKCNNLVVGTLGQYEYRPDSRLLSGDERCPHVRIVIWKFAVAREKDGPDSFPETKQLGKTTYWLSDEETEAILGAVRIPLSSYSKLIREPVTPTPKDMSEAPVSLGSSTLKSWLDENERQAATLKKSELHKRAEQANPVPRKVESNGTVYIRDSFVAAYAKKLAAGVCDLCNQPAPFLTLDTEPYLESHHVIWLSQGGYDLVKNVVALCPNCHRKIHSRDDEADREQLLFRISNRSSEQ